jgi:phage/plasmid-like protein (TIGR03299 family)
MAHQLDTRENGAASFVSLRQSAWHQLGTIVADELSFDEAMHLGGLDYPLALRPIATTIPVLDANDVEIDSLALDVPNHRAVVRADRNTVLGVVSDRYELVTNRQAMQMVDVLVEDGLAVIETAGVLREGADAWMALRFTGDRIDAAGENGGDEIKFYGLVRTNHNGKASVQVATTPVRVVCANTLAMAMANGRTTVRSVLHVGANAAGKGHQAAKDLWTGTVADAEAMAAAFATMRSTSLSEAEFAAAVLDTLCPLPEALDADASKVAKSLYPSRVAKAEATRFTIQQLWVNGTGQLGACTSWDAFNAATEALDHYDVLPVKGEKLTAMLPTGRIAQTKATVFSKLLALTV